MSKIKAIDFDPNFKPLEPALVLTADIPGTGTKVVTKLYGTVTPQRAAAERKEVRYRAEQLAPAPVRERRERSFVPKRDEYAGEFAPVGISKGKPRRLRKDDAYA